MQARDGRQALQVLHRERQGAVHHAMDRERVLPGIDVRQEGATRRRPVMKRRWGDHADGILKRRRHMKHEPEGIGRRPSAVGNAHRSDEMGSLPVCDQLLAAPDHRRSGCWCLASGCRRLAARYRRRADRRIRAGPSAHRACATRHPRADRARARPPGSPRCPSSASRGSQMRREYTPSSAYSGLKSSAICCRIFGSTMRVSPLSGSFSA